MEGPFSAMAAAASITTDGVARSAFIAATQHFLHTHGNQSQLRPRAQPTQSPASQARCSSCGRGFAVFGVGLALRYERRGLPNDRMKVGNSKGAEHTRDLLPLKPATLGTIGFTCGSAASIVAAVGGSSVGDPRRNAPSSSSGLEEQDGSSLNALLALLRAPGRFWTNVLLAANIAVFLGQLATGQDRIMYWGAKVNELISRGQFWRFITANFLHSGWGHLLMNCYSLNNLGPSWERVAGGRRFLAVYTAASVATVLASYKFSRAPSVGASGAIFGLVGALCVFSFRYMRLFRGGEGREMFNSLVQTVALNVLLGASMQRVDNWGHAGGFLGGAAVAWVLGPAYELNYYAGLLTDRPPLKRLIEFLGDKGQAKSA